MKVLFTGKGTSGSWRMRGEQLGAAMGATVQPRATSQGNHDIAVVVKRIHGPANFRRWVWDLVDFYPQPASCAWSGPQAITWVREQIQAMKPTAIIWPTQKMREDCDTGLPGVVIPHHCRAGLKASTEKGLVGYEGAVHYLGKWLPALQQVCEERGLKLVLNPPDYSKLEYVVAFRDNPGYVCSNWKSAVKYENARAIGAKFIAQPEAGYLERAGLNGAQWVWHPLRLSHAFEVAMPAQGNLYTIEDAAADLKAFLHAL